MHRKHHLIFFVIQAGFEPTTHSLEGCCSIQLSYWTRNRFFFASAKLVFFLNIAKFISPAFAVYGTVYGSLHRETCNCHETMWAFDGLSSIKTQQP